MDKNTKDFFKIFLSMAMENNTFQMVIIFRVILNKENLRE